MCGRFSMSVRPEEMSSHVQALNLILDDIRNGRQATISQNVGPTKYGAVYRAARSEESDEPGAPVDARVVEYMKWGLVPSYFKDQKQGGKMFNCRIESLVENRPVWSGPKKHHRCLVFIEGYYEWEKDGSKTIIPHYVKRKDGKLMCLAGLWDRNTKDGVIDTFTIITTPAHPDIRWLHDRMPAMVDPEDEMLNNWLDPTIGWNEEKADFTKFIKSRPVDDLEIYEVSSKVNKIGVHLDTLNQPVKVSARPRPASSFFSSPKAKRPRAKVESGSETEGAVKEESPTKERHRHVPGRKSAKVEGASPKREEAQADESHQ